MRRFSVLLRGALAGGLVGSGGAGALGGAITCDLADSTDELFVSLAVPFVSKWFSVSAGSVAARFASASLREPAGASGGAGGALLGGPVAVAPPPTESDLKNSSRLLCNCNQYKMISC